MEGSAVPHHKFGFPSRLQLIAAWFDLAWFRWVSDGFQSPRYLQLLIWWLSGARLSSSNLTIVRGQVVIVPIFTDQVAHLFSPDCRYRYIHHMQMFSNVILMEVGLENLCFRSIWGRLPKVDSWVPSLFLASASVVNARLEANLSDQVDHWECGE